MLYERALAVGQVRPGRRQLALLPSTSPVADNLQAALPGGRHLLVAAAPVTATFDAFAARARQGGAMVPVTRQVVLDGDTPVSAFAKLHRGPYGFLLESLEGGERWARYTFLSTDPARGLPLPRARVRPLDRRPPVGGTVETDVAPLEHLGRLLRRHPPVDVPGLPRFTGGAVGYLGYDIVRTIESLPDAPPDDRDLPDAVMMVTDTLLVLDNLYNRATVIANVEVRARGGRRGAPPALRRGGGADRGLGRPALRPGTIQPLAHRAAAPRCRRRSRPTPTTGSRTTCAGSRSTSPPATPSRPCSRAGWRWRRPIRS